MDSEGNNISEYYFSPDDVKKLKNIIHKLSIPLKTRTDCQISASNGDDRNVVASDIILLERIANFLEDSNAEQQQISKIEVHLSEKFNSISLDVHPVATNDLILIKLFGLLDMQTLKNCRAVCRRWERISGPFFRTRVKVVLSSPEKSLEKYLKDFDSVQQFEEIEFLKTATCFSSSLGQLFLKNGYFLTSLTFKNVTMSDDDGKLNKFDLSSLIGENLEKLHLDCRENSTQMIVSSNNLVSAKYLYLNDCTILVDKDMKKSIAKEYYFFDITCIVSIKDHIPRFVPPVVCISTVEKITIKYGLSLLVVAINPITRHFETIHASYFPELPGLLKECPKLKHLKVLNPEECNFSLSMLPNTLESLSLLCYSVQPIISPPLKFPPNLREFCFDISSDAGKRSMISLMSALTTCYTLEKVHLTASDLHLERIDLKWLPKSVKVLRLENISIEGTSEEFSHYLEALHLSNYSLENVAPILMHFQMEILSLSFKGHLCLTTENVDSFLEMSKKPSSELAVGALHWRNDSEDYINSPLSQITDRRSEYYVFKYGNGRAVTSQAFEKIYKESMSLYLHVVAQSN